MPFIVGLTGGIGSGKSTLASCFREHGAIVIDADGIARELTEPGSPVLDELVESFGADILDASGLLRRSVLAERAFSSDENTKALNEIMHARIREEAERRISQFAKDAIVVYDMPLLVETGSEAMCDFVVVVEAPVEIRVSRLLEHRNLAEADIRQRIGQQASDQARAEIADLVVRNDSDVAELRAQCESAWNRICLAAETP